MGVSRSVYLGPYIIIKSKPKMELVDRCKDHDFPITDKFCRVCGTAQNNRMTRQTVNTFDYEDFYTKNLVPIDITDDNGWKYLIPNTGDYNKYHDISSYSDFQDGVLQLSSPYIINANKLFCQTFDDPLEMIRISGVDYEVVFGLITYHC